jgi:uncharacterized membrane-anchored protein YitT (DUF2179 family)
MTDEAAITLHRPYEDVAAILTGALMVALGVTFFATAGLATGGTAGLALLLGHATGFDFGAVFFVLNLPFYVLAVRKMGWKLAARTFVAVLLVSLFAKVTSASVDMAHVDPVFAAAAGGALTGIGILILFRHRMSLGGVNLLALYLQEHHGMRAGYVQMASDALILLASIFVLGLDKLALSLLGTGVLNLVLAMNHRPGRYTGMS